MQAIVTKYHGPRGSHGSRIKATAGAGSVFLSVDNGMSVDMNHLEAARKLAQRFKWTGRYVEGGLPDGSKVWVCVTHGSPLEFYGSAE